MRLRWILLSSVLSSAACAAPIDPQPDPWRRDVEDVVALPVPEELAACFPRAGEEPIGEACEALGADTICTGVCLATCMEILG